MLQIHSSLQICTTNIWRIPTRWRPVGEHSSRGLIFARESYGDDFFQESVPQEVSTVAAPAASSVASSPQAAPVPVSGKVEKELQVLNLIKAYQRQGHLLAQIDPLKERKAPQVSLSLEKFGLSQADLSTVFRCR